MSDTISSNDAQLDHGPQIPKAAILVAAIVAFVVAIAVMFPSER